MRAVKEERTKAICVSVVSSPVKLAEDREVRGDREDDSLYQRAASRVFPLIRVASNSCRGMLVEVERSR